MVEALKSEESFLNGSVRALGGEVKALHETLAGLQNDLQLITERLPEGGGPLQKVRDALTGGEE